MTAQPKQWLNNCGGTSNVPESSKSPSTKGLIASTSVATHSPVSVPNKSNKLTLEQRFIEHWFKAPVRGITLIPQYQFHPTRKYRFDFAIIPLKIAIEIDGFGMGHQSNASMAYDHHRQNEAISLGWVVMRFTAKNLSKTNLPISMSQVLNTILVRQSQLLHSRIPPFGVAAPHKGAKS